MSAHRGEARNPYPGPRPFTVDEEHLFFGRLAETRDLFSLVAAHRAVFLYAESGAGKTSLVHAGLMPLLTKEGFQILPSVRLGGIVPKGVNERHILNIFAFNTLISWAGNHTALRGLSKLRLAPYISSHFKRRSVIERNDPLVAVFDQFEEIFTFYAGHWDKRVGFFEQILEVIEACPRLRLIFVIREDYIAALEPYTAIVPRRYRTRFRLERLRRDAALTAIKGPLEKSGSRFAKGVAEKLVNDLLAERYQSEDGEIAEIRGEFVEPVQLQVVCRELWNPHAKKITLKHLLSLGSVDKALSKFYDAAVSVASQKSGVDEGRLRKWCEANLITSVGTRNTVYRGPQYTMEMPNLAIDELESAHLIRAEWRAGARWYELTHDRLIEPLRNSNAGYRLRIGKWRRLSQKSQRTLIEGIHLLQQQDHHQALEMVDNALATATTIGDSWGKAASTIAKADVLRELGEYDTSLELSYQALDFFAKTDDKKWIVGILTGIASTYRLCERYPEEASIYTRALRVEHSPSLLYRRAIAYWYAGLNRKALADLTRLMATTSSPPPFDWLNARGQAFAEIGKAREAIADLELAIKIEKSDIGIAYARNGLGLAYAYAGRNEDALAQFRLSIASCPDNAWVYFNRGIALDRMGKREEALTDYRTALAKTAPKLNPSKRIKAEQRIKSKSPNRNV